MARRRSDCSVLVGKPVEGPPRWMSMISSGNSRLMARPMGSALRVTPGPLVVGTPRGPVEGVGFEAGAGTPRRTDADLPGEGSPQGCADTGDLVLRLHRADAEVLV